MNTHIQRCGTSLAIPIPKAFVEKLVLQPDDEVEITLLDEQIIIRPTQGKTYALDDLLAGITTDNRHGPWDMGSAIGNEVW